VIKGGDYYERLKREKSTLLLALIISVIVEGLCVVQSIISRANGDIQVESKAGEGSTFFVTLPINSIRKSRRIGDEK